MIEVRSAVSEDAARLRELWRICFGDSEAFMDWFFTERFFPECSSVLTEDGVIMSALQSYPLHIRIRNALIPASMLAGVSTHPDRNGRGYMKQIFLHYMQRTRGFGIPAVIHTPANLSTFFSRGHFPATDTKHVDIDAARADALPPGIIRQSLYEELSLLQICYQRVTAGYSGCVSRTMADFSFKCRDYASDGAQCLVFRRDHEVAGYCIYYVMENSLHAEECFALDADTYTLLLEALQHEANGRALHVKLPPDAPVSLEQATQRIRPQGVVGIANVSAMLRWVIGNPSFVFEIADATVPQNAGIFNGAGGETNAPPQLRMEAGRLGQFLCGYRSLAELVRANEAEALDLDAMRILDKAYPKQICFITDEY